MENDDPKSGEVLPPETETPTGDKLNILALIQNYTNRPDLFLAKVEEHDPGFIKRLNESAATHSEQLREGKFRFGKIQAYTALVVQCMAAAVLLGVTAYAVISGIAGFGIIIALTIFFAVTQSGMAGFLSIASALKEKTTMFRKGDD